MYFKVTCIYMLYEGTLYFSFQILHKYLWENSIFSLSMKGFTRTNVTLALNIQLGFPDS